VSAGKACSQELYGGGCHHAVADPVGNFNQNFDRHEILFTGSY